MPRTGKQRSIRTTATARPLKEPVARSVSEGTAVNDAVACLRRLARGSGPARSELGALQSTGGNASVARLLRAGQRPAPPLLQAKLLVGAADDPLEREADRVADQVMRTWSTVPTPATVRPDEAHHARLRRLVEPGQDPTSAFEADASVARRLAARRGGGHILPPPLRDRMEAGFGADLTGVRIHRDAEAAELSTGLAARAFTHGRDIYFGRGAYDPTSRSGQHLLAHELSHVVQQTSGTAGNTARRRRVSEAIVQRRVPRLSLFKQIVGVPEDATALRKLKKAVRRTILDQGEAVVSAVEEKLGHTVDEILAASDAAGLEQLVRTTEVEREALVNRRFEAEAERAGRVAKGPTAGRPLPPRHRGAIEQQVLLVMGRKDAALRELTDDPMSHPGAAATFVPWRTLLTDPGDQSALLLFVQAAISAIRRAGKDTAAIKRVFGEPHHKKAKNGFIKAAKGLDLLVNKNMMGADTSGESRQMCFGGLTSTERMLLPEATLRNFQNDADGAHLHKVVHESFHAGDKRIKDEGGYRHEVSFTGRTATDKLRNAEHYVEVVAQSEGWNGASARTLRPPVGGHGAPHVGPDIVGRAQQQATDTLRNAWIAGLNIHSLLKDVQATQMLKGAKKVPPKKQASLREGSQLLGLSLHRRAPADAMLPEVTDLDIALSEGTVRRLARAYGREMSSKPTTVGAWGKPLPPGNEQQRLATIKALMIEQALSAVGPILKDLDKDKWMVLGLNQRYSGQKVSARS